MIELRPLRPGRPILPVDELLGSLEESGPIRYFDVPKLTLPMVSPGISSALSITEVIKNRGNTVPAMLDYMLRKERKSFFLLIDTLKEMIPGLEDVDIETPDPQTRRVDLVMDNGLRMPADNVSMGVRLMIFFATLAYHPDPPSLILIEEPETGVHPKRLSEIMKLLRGISHGATGYRPAQIIVSTHSPYLLDCVDLDSDQVIVFQRLDDGRRVANPMDSERLKKYMEDFMLGEFWFNGR